jgi:hypothetical protein
MIEENVQESRRDRAGAPVDAVDDGKGRKEK